jgi:HK97 family phage major capsid protein
MPESIQQKRERRNELARETRNLLDKNTGAEWGAEQQAKYDANIAEIEAIDGEIARHQKLLDLQAEKEFEGLGVRERDDIEANPARSLFNKWLRGGDKALNAEEWATIRNTMSTTTDSEGGYTVPEEWATSVLEALKAFGGMRAVATIIQTENGQKINYPTSDGTAEEGEIVAQNASATDADPSFGTKNLDVYKFSSKVITVPIELIQDSAVNVEQFVRGRIETRLGRITNRLYTTGTGVSQPTGIVTAAPLGKAGATSATAVITYEDLLDLEHSVDPAYRAMNPRWMMNDAMLKLIRGLKDTDGRPLYLPSYDAGIRGGVPEELMGKPIQINQHVAEPAPGAKSILFGDFTNYIIRDAMQMTLFRFTDSAYAKKGQVGFLAWMRSGGNFVDVGGAVKHFQHGPAA